MLVSPRPGSTWLIRNPSQLEPYDEAADVSLCRFYLALFLTKTSKAQRFYNLFKNASKICVSQTFIKCHCLRQFLHSIFNNLQKLRLLARKKTPFLLKLKSCDLPCDYAIRIHRPKVLADLANLISQVLK